MTCSAEMLDASNDMPMNGQRSSRPARKYSLPELFLPVARVTAYTTRARLAKIVMESIKESTDGVSPHSEVSGLSGDAEQRDQNSRRPESKRRNSYRSSGKKGEAASLEDPTLPRIVSHARHTDLMDPKSESVEFR